MKKHIKIALVVLSCVMACAMLASCKKVVGKVKGVVIPDGVFINNFATQVYTAQDNDDTGIDFDLQGEELYNSVKDAKKDGKSYFDIFVEDALEESRQFMIQLQVFSEKEGWPTEDEIKTLTDSAKSYLSQMYQYYGSSVGAANEGEMAQKGYNMTYDDLIEYFTLTSTLQKFKSNLQSKVTVSDDELTEFYKENESQYRQVQVRHSLFKTEKMDDEEKAALRDEVQALVDQYNEGKLTMDEIVAKSEDVDSTGKPNEDGYYTVDSTSNFVKEFKEWALNREAASNEIAIVESEFGYHVMQCTKILDLSDETLKKNVDTAYRTKVVDEQLDGEIKPYYDNKDYKMKSVDRKYVDKIAKRTFTGDFSDVKTTATASAAAATPTAKPEYNDAAADTTQVAKYKDTVIYKAYYTQYFSQAMNERITEAGVDFSSAGDSEEKTYELLNEFMQKEYKDGKTNLEYVKEHALNLLTQFLASKDMAAEAGITYTDEKKKEVLDEFDEQVDSMLSYYSSAYAISTRDDLMKLIMYMNVNDYKNLYIDQMIVSDYSKDIIGKMKPEDSALKAFYDSDPDAYRIVTIRHITRSLLDKDGNKISDAEQAEVLKLMETLKAKLEAGDSAEAIVEGYSTATDVSTAKGLVDLSKSASSMAKEVIDWAFAQTQTGAITIIKTDSSYELVIVEGLTDYTSSTGTVANKTNTTSTAIVTAVTTAYKNDAFEKSINQYIADHSIALTDVNREVVDQVATTVLTYEKKETSK